MLMMVVPQTSFDRENEFIKSSSKIFDYPFMLENILINSISSTYLEVCSSRPSASAEIDWVGIDDKEDDFCDDDSFALVNFDFVRCCVYTALTIMAKTITMRTPMNALPMLLLLMPTLLPSWPRSPPPERLPLPIKKRSRAAAI